MDVLREIPHNLPVPDLTKEFNKMVRLLRSWQPKNSATVRVATYSNGTMWHVKPAPAPQSGGGGATVPLPGNMSFTAEARTGEVDGADVVEVKMLGGTVQGLFGAVQVFKTTYWTDGGGAPELFGDYNSATDELEDASISDGDLFWLEYDPEADEGERWSIEHGAELPEDATHPGEEEPNYFSVVPLFRVRLSEEEKGVVQNHVAGVYVPTLSNVVDVQKAQDGEDDGGEEEGEDGGEGGSEGE